MPLESLLNRNGHQRISRHVLSNHANEAHRSYGSILYQIAILCKHHYLFFNDGVGVQMNFIPTISFYCTNHKIKVAKNTAQKLITSCLHIFLTKNVRIMPAVRDLILPLFSGSRHSPTITLA